MDITIKQVTVKDLDGTLLRYFGDKADLINNMYGNKFNWGRFPVKWYVEHHPLFVAYAGSKPVGFMAASLTPCLFDPGITLLRQELLYGETPLVTGKLFRYFIDFGKVRANHIIACIGEHTNIKPTSMERLGFTKLETNFRMEV